MFSEFSERGGRGSLRAKLEALAGFALRICAPFAPARPVPRFQKAFTTPPLTPCFFCVRRSRAKRQEITTSWISSRLASSQHTQKKCELFGAPRGALHQEISGENSAKQKFCFLWGTFVYFLDVHFLIYCEYPVCHVYAMMFSSSESCIASASVWVRSPSSLSSRCKAL